MRKYSKKALYPKREAPDSITPLVSQFLGTRAQSTETLWHPNPKSPHTCLASRCKMSRSLYAGWRFPAASAPFLKASQQCQTCCNRRPGMLQDDCHLISTTSATLCANGGSGCLTPLQPCGAQHGSVTWVSQARAVDIHSNSPVVKEA